MRSRNRLWRVVSGMAWAPASVVSVGERAHRRSAITMPRLIAVRPCLPISPRMTLNHWMPPHRFPLVMGAFYVACEVAGISQPGKWVLVPSLLVDTGSEYTWIQEDLLRQASVQVAKKDLAFVMANGQTITRSIGYAFLRAQTFETVDEVVLAQPGDLTLLGARTLEGFGAAV